MCTILQKLKLLTSLLTQLKITIPINITYNTNGTTAFKTEVNSTFLSQVLPVSFWKLKVAFHVKLCGRLFFLPCPRHLLVSMVSLTRYNLIHGLGLHMQVVVLATKHLSLRLLEVVNKLNAIVINQFNSHSFCSL